MQNGSFFLNKKYLFWEYVYLRFLKSFLTYQNHFYSFRSEKPSPYELHIFSWSMRFHQWPTKLLNCGILKNMSLIISHWLEDLSISSHQSSWTKVFSLSVFYIFFKKKPILQREMVQKKCMFYMRSFDTNSLNTDIFLSCQPVITYSKVLVIYKLKEEELKRKLKLKYSWFFFF